MKSKIYYFIVLSIVLFLGCADAYECVIKGSTIEKVGIGDPAEKVYSVFESRYRIIGEEKPHSVSTLSLYQGNEVIMKVSLDPDNRVLFIDAYDKCVTLKQIGVGSTLRELIKTYGKGQITPTDEGYLINFKSAKSLAFLLDDRDIPKRLRNIPDDVFNESQEKEILRLKNVRVCSIKIVSRE